ncbi:methionyl-tRNA formyltransferase [Synechococcus sp. Tobar12-5m-g]|uniref:methionyl-tRNA formyltransferase n=1 Tax=unclassified Synechococcus TaxID=2626047 RepID=UPI0020CBA649|nr:MULTISPECIES: methionyl-tRNA formyltransferase [unclassified Synechococcus]MCP9772768.1 methionyl-tRNA formyltransferase [Synechococcus sp. Tobar12-5m-g]MCP9873595.1 methionyl-tRNA formyltransferase [Synechococcus sp. Cruz CV-v-12]
MKILFWGTPAYAVPSLEALVGAGHGLVGVVSQPDRRRGRGSALVPSAVKERALEMGLPVFTPERIRREPELQAILAALGADLSVVVAFGQILPKEVLAQPPLGCWNGHGSLLPRWRGAAPIQWSLIEGDRETGVGIMAMEEGLDTGPVLLERRLAIGPLENAEGLARRLSQLTADLLVEAMPLIERAGPGPLAERLRRLGVRHQPEQADRYARLLGKQDYRINWAEPGLAIHRKVMGLYPGAHTSWQGQRLRLLATEPAAARGAGTESPPGTVLEAVPSVGLVVGTGEGALLIREAQRQGKTAARGQGLIQQLGAKPGDRLGACNP